MADNRMTPNGLIPGGTFTCGRGDDSMRLKLFTIPYTTAIQPSFNYLNVVRVLEELWKLVGLELDWAGRMVPAMRIKVVYFDGPGAPSQYADAGIYATWLRA